MSQRVRILLLEDCKDDAQLILHELRHAGIDPIGDRVETERDFIAHLDDALLDDGVREEPIRQGGGVAPRRLEVSRIELDGEAATGAHRGDPVEAERGQRPLDRGALWISDPGAEHDLDARVVPHDERPYHSSRERPVTRS